MAYWIKKLIVLTCILTFSFAVYSGSETDWPGWRGKNFDGSAAGTGSLKFGEGHGLKIAWQKTLGSGYSSVSVANGQAVTLFSDKIFDYVVALNAETGAEQWRCKIDSTYAGHDGSHTGPISTPVIAGDKVFALGPKGHLLAIDARTGKKAWSAHMVTDHKSLPPFYGFATSPLVDGNVLVVETGGPGNTISGFDKNSGKLLWSTGADTVNYQSPAIFSFAGEKHLVCVGDKYLYGLNPQTGAKLWQYHHNGGNQAINPVMAGENKLLINHKESESILLQIKKENTGYKIDSLFTTRGVKQSLNTSVYHEGYLFGYSGVILTCVNAGTGATTWKSRPPGDGFLILVDGHLVIVTKKGTLHVAEASPAGYREVASLKLFSGATWTPPSFANGKIYARSLNDIASVEIARLDQPATVTTKVTPEKKLDLSGSKFMEFVRKVETAENKKAVIDAFMASQKQFPVIENERLVHFVWRGDAKDLAISGDMFNLNDEHPLHRVAGTDFYYYSIELEPDAVVGYQMIKDYEERIVDPLNKNKTTSFNGENAVLYMPKTESNAHLDETDGLVKGKIDSFQFKSKILDNERKIDVYLPPSYETSGQRYPVLFVNYGEQALQWGKMANTLDNLAGKSFEPVIAVFVHLNPQARFREIAGEKYAQMIADELVPFIDAKYRTQANADARAIMGGSSAGYSAILLAFKHPGVFGKIAGQSTNLDAPRGEELAKLANAAEKLPIEFYLHWGKYDLRDGDTLNRAGVNAAFTKVLREKGYVVHGGEKNIGYGFASWRTQTDDILATFFPVKKTKK